MIINEVSQGENIKKIKLRNKQGDCIDCFQCVKVCPTGIDIRNGTQMECVGCTACIDACDKMMDAVAAREDSSAMHLKMVLQKERNSGIPAE